MEIQPKLATFKIQNANKQTKRNYTTITTESSQQSRLKTKYLKMTIKKVAASLKCKIHPKGNE